MRTFNAASPVSLWRSLTKKILETFDAKSNRSRMANWLDPVSQFVVFVTAQARLRAAVLFAKVAQLDI